MRYRLRRLLHELNRVGEWVLHDRLGLRDSEARLFSDSQRYWEGASAPGGERGHAHWRAQGVFANDDERWLALGRNNLRILENLAGARSLGRRALRIVEWGCGGGANAVHFGRGAARYYGIDVTEANLLECRQQMEAAGLESFVPVLIRVSNPEQVTEVIEEPCDLLISTYVFELVPSKEYGKQVLALSHRLLSSGGLAFIQIKYDDLAPTSRGYRWNYAKNMASMTTYRVDEFWTLAEECGFVPVSVFLEPKQPLVHDRRYAYFLLRRP